MTCPYIAPIYYLYKTGHLLLTQKILRTIRSSHTKQILKVNITCFTKKYFRIAKTKIYDPTLDDQSKHYLFALQSYRFHFLAMWLAGFFCLSFSSVTSEHAIIPHQTSYASSSLDKNETIFVRLKETLYETSVV